MCDDIADICSIERKMGTSTRTFRSLHYIDMLIDFDALYRTCFIVPASYVLGMLAMFVDDPPSLSELVFHLMPNQTFFFFFGSTPTPPLTTSPLVSRLLCVYVFSEVLNLTLFLLELR